MDIALCLSATVLFIHCELLDGRPEGRGRNGRANEKDRDGEGKRN